MNKLFTTFIMAALLAGSAMAKETASSKLPEGAVSNVSVERSASSLLVRMDINPAVFSSQANKEIWINPMLVSSNGSDTLKLTSVDVAGRTRYYHNLREDGRNPGYVMLRSGKDNSYAYAQTVTYEPWMEKGNLVIESVVDGCCGDALAASETRTFENFDFRPKEIMPEFSYVKPMHESVKTRAVSGRANIDFPVNQIVIYPDFHNNPKELAEVRRTIDEIRNDKDVNITSLSIKGFASPEGSYENNERLAKGRTEALVGYVANLYKFPQNVLHSSWEAEDWGGLEQAIMESEAIGNKDAILAVIRDQSLSPDARDAELKKKFPAQYAEILNGIYPGLRHSEYIVEYVVRNYTDVSEIANVMKKAPQNLSLEELFAYAQTLDRESPEFREVMEVAVRMFPDDPTANLNAANTAIEHGEYDLARNYLKKADKTPQTCYTIGVLEAKTGNYKEAKTWLEKAAAGGITDANRILADMRDWNWIE